MLWNEHKRRSERCVEQSRAREGIHLWICGFDEEIEYSFMRPKEYVEQSMIEKRSCFYNQLDWYFS